MIRAFVFLFAGLLLADDLQRKADEKRVEEYHHLNAKSKRVSADMQAFIDKWARDCQARGQELKMDATGDPGCQNKPAPIAKEKP